MALEAGTKLGPYEILSPLGAGGMGEVYRAKDTRLGRDVAIKVLPSHLTANNELKQRFEREAKAISSLTHPNICTLHDIGNDDGIDFLVMELLEGETLAHRLNKGRLSLEEVLRFGFEIVSALDRAHRAGIVHRDLKPGNIMLTKSGAKLLDFGLARNATGQSGLSTAPDAATITEPLTGKGTIVGTFQYMAPEQLEGKEADHRTDIFAFGAVLYEMYTGKRAFEGASRASLIASIMTAQPRAISELQPMTPPALEHLVRSCLAKDAEDRIQTAHDVKLQLHWIAEGGSQIGAPAPVVARRRSRERIAWALLSAMTLLAIALSWIVFSTDKPTAKRAIHADLNPPNGCTYEYRKGPPMVSPDGRRIAFVARTETGQSQLWVRNLGDTVARQLPGTDGASYPFWSPDSNAIGFFNGRHLKRINVQGNRTDIICETKTTRGGASWNTDGTILFSLRSGGLVAVSASGGVPKNVTELDRSKNEFTHRAPWFLPDQQHFLFSTRRGIGGANGVSVGSLDGMPPKRILEVDSNAVFIDPGYLLYWRDGAVRAQRFDSSTLAVVGKPFAVALETRYEPDDTMALFSASAAGTLVYHSGGGATAKSRLIVFDRAGNKIGTVGPPGNYYAPRFSHDGKLVAVDASGVQNNGDIWIYGMNSSTAIRLTSDAADESCPIWSPDDDRVLFLSGKGGPDNIYAKHLNNLVEEDAIVVDKEASLEPTDVSRDGKFLAYNKSKTDDGGGGDIWVLALETGATEALVESRFTNENLRFSPDGEWVAYNSDETGQMEVFLQTFPSPGQRTQVSVGGGFGPKWRGDGEELFFRSLDGTLMSLAVNNKLDTALAAPVPLFKVRSRHQDSAMDFDVSWDGQSILVNTSIEDDEARPMSVVIDFMDEWKHK